MDVEPGWTADTEEVDQLLNDLKSWDPEAYRIGQANVRAREQRLQWLSTLAKQRESQLLDQTDVAARMGTSQSAVARLEGGLTDPKLSTLQRFAEAIGHELQLTLTIREEKTVSIEYERLEAVMRDVTKSLSHHKPEKEYAFSFYLPDPAEGKLRLEILPGDITISGSVAKGADLADVIDKVSGVTEAGRITVDVGIDMSRTIVGSA